MEYEEKVYSTGRGFSNIETRRGVAGNPWHYGYVATPYGIVIVMNDPDNNICNFDFVADGKLYIRYFNKSFSKRGLAQKAKQFAKEKALYD